MLSILSYIYYFNINLIFNRFKLSLQESKDSSLSGPSNLTAASQNWEEYTDKKLKLTSNEKKSLKLEKFYFGHYN